MKKSTDKKTTKRSGGRPSREQAERIEETILDVAGTLFFAEGYGATSIDAIARAARISKRTFYSRYKDKAEIFNAVMQRVIDRLRPPGSPILSFEGQKLEDILRRLALIIVRASLSPEALALQRMIVAEAARFPELARIIGEQGARKDAVQRIAALLKREAHTENLAIQDHEFAAEQFLQMLVGLPQRRGLGLGTPMNDAEITQWAGDTVTLFLNGCRARA